ncbi:MerR family transcriptional regulator [Nocardia sp. NPDC058640]|uniref:DNA polymerase III subunit beta family protein n=1 Tax=Nocardia sp. NPDC058640 TaxID=3346571 RepID=UPI00364BDAA0
MPDTDLITIGAFARACGLSASALRFYADAGVLAPAVVDDVTGYRYYTPDQSDTARLIRHLRAVDMPLPAVAAVLAEPDPSRAAELVDLHLADLDRHLTEVRAAATAARTALRTGRAVSDKAPISPDGCEADAPGDPIPTTDHTVWLSGPMLAAAIDQVATATITDPTMPVLDTILFETARHELTLTATDRYRLTTRTLRPTRGAETAWTATINAEDLRTTVSWLRRQHSVAIRPTPEGIEFTTPATDSEVNPAAGQPSIDENAHRHCRRSTENFPDYRAMLTALPPVRTRVVIARTDLLTALESADTPTITLHTHPSTLSVGHHSLPATVTGPAMTLHFPVTTLYPAIAAAVGPDVMLDLIAPDHPARVRSADEGALSTLAMPCQPTP